MIFKRIGQFATRYRHAVLLTWIGLAVIITLIAPNIEDVASSDQADMLPSNAPFVHADEVYQATFPDSFAPGSSVIVIDATNNGGVLNPDAATFEERIDTPVARFIAQAIQWLSSDDAPENIQAVVGPTQSPITADLMVSPDNRVAIINVELSTSNPDEATTAALHAIDDWLADNRPAGLGTYQTGAAPIVSNTTESVTTSVDRTIWVTVALVIVLLIAIYRSPVSPLIPLAAVTISYLITRGIVAWMGQELLTITSYANVLLVVVLYGAGTDYCLFLISRFREELADDVTVAYATTETVHRVGETITSSAGTIFVGFMAMVFAEMGIFNTSGPALAIGIIMVLLAGLTLVPALLAVMGEKAFWPGKAHHRTAGRYYEAASKFVSSRPLVTIVVIVAIMAPLAYYGLTTSVTYDLLADLPDDTDSVIGFDILRNSLGAGTVLPLTVVVTERESGAQMAADIATLGTELAALNAVADVRSLDSPLGANADDFNHLLHVDTQLGMAADLLGGGFDTSLMQDMDPQQIGTLLQSVNQYFDMLAEQFPAIQDDPNLQTIQELLGSPLQLIQRQDELASAVNGLAETFANDIDAPYALPLSLLDAVASLPASGSAALDPASLQSLVDSYLNEDRTAFKIDVILSNNLVGTEAMDTVNDIRDILANYDREGDAVVSGGTAINTDIRDTMDRDLLRAIGLVLLGIFIVLLIMLRSVVAPLYLIATVVLSFTFTLGLTNLVFQHILYDVEGLTWYVPFFVFVFLVALGVDYSIFLIGRIKEEIPRHGIREGVHIAVAATGAIITSAGIILAGTFGAMMAGEVMGLLEVGFAVAVGVLIDTFVVRTLLVPALTTWLGELAWWPGGIPKADPGTRKPRKAPSTPAGD